MMGRRIDAIAEWINPRWGKHRSVPPMEAGLRPNNLLEQAEPLLSSAPAAPDALAVLGGRLFFSSGEDVYEHSTPGTTLLATLPGRVTALTALEGGLLAAVEGRGITHISPAGVVTDALADAAVRMCVTDLAVRADGTIIAAVGSTTRPSTEWSSALLLEESDGALLVIRGGSVEHVAADLPWPSGVAWDGDDVIISLSLAHRIERRRASALDQDGEPLARNMASYPGRIEATADGWWFVPRLGLGNPWTDPLQIGQIRVLGVVKPWAPARSYGLAFKMSRNGRITQSHHSRVDGERHGVTGVAVLGDDVVVSAHGTAALYRLATKE